MAGAISLSDLHGRRVPNGLWLAVLTAGWGAAWWTGGATALGAHALSAVVILIVFGLQAGQGWIGWGDAKAAAALAAWLLPPLLPAFLLATALSGGGLALGCAIPRAIRRHRRYLVRARQAGRVAAALAVARDPVLRRTPVPLAVALALAATAIAFAHPAPWWPVMTLLHARG